jgi:hypothetical protein
MNVSWNYYLRRRRVDVQLLLKKQNIKDYDSLARFLASTGVDSPPEAEVAHYFVKEVPPQPLPEIKKPTPRRRPAKQSVKIAAEDRNTKSKKSTKAKADEQS